MALKDGTTAVYIRILYTLALKGSQRCAGKLQDVLQVNSKMLILLQEKKVVSLNSRTVAESQRETRKKVICRDLSIFI